MPIEIRELKVTGFINKNQAQGANSSNTLSKNEIDRLKRSIVKECTDKVLEKLERKARR